MSGRSRKKDQQEQEQEQQQEEQSESTQESGSDDNGQSQQPRRQAAELSSRRQEPSAGELVRRTESRELQPDEVFDPISATRLATLRLARSWRFGGNTYAAMHAYERILAKYGGTPAAHAAAEELIAMAGELERDGKFYTALNIFNKVEEYYEPATYGDRYDQPRPTRYRSRRR